MRELSEERILSGLNDEQLEAVKFGSGPLMIVAGAGTGKTKVITHRIAYLILTKQALPEEILALTFTDKAASEMEERVDILLPYGFSNVAISTFHSFGDRLLREYAFNLGLSSDFEVLSRPEQVIFLKERIFDFDFNIYRPLGDPTRFIDSILTLYSRAKDEDISPDEYLAYVEKYKRTIETNEPAEEQIDFYNQHLELARGYKKLQEFMAKEGKVDFGDQVYLTLHLLRQNPSILSSIQARYKFILIDEFQDTNYSQFQMIKLMAGKQSNITVVADDDQSIYKFRGAAISNILNFKDVYPDAQLVVLTKNYRSTQAILDASYKLICHNNPDRLEVKENIDKRLVALEPGEKFVTHIHYDTLTGEADAVADIIERKVKENKFQYNDFAILVRSNNHADAYMRSLNMRSIPFRFTGNRGLYSREEVRILISFLKVIANVDDSMQLYHLVTSDIYRIPMIDISTAMSIANRQHKSLYYVLTHPDELEIDFGEEALATIEKIVADIKLYLDLSRDDETGVLLYKFLKNTNYLNRLIEEDSDYKIKNIARFFEVVRNFRELALDNDRVFIFVKHLEALIEAGDDPATAEADLDDNAVNIMTIHKSKGLEFPIVFMVSLVKEKFPSRNRKDPIALPNDLIKDVLPSGDFHIQEERRLFYVGMTRAKRELYLTSARDYGGKRTRKISQFVVEAMDKLLADEDYLKTSPLEAIEKFAPIVKNPTDHYSIIPDDHHINLSHYIIDYYLTCPLKYKYIHILRVPLMPHHSIIYGKAIHEAVKEYHLNKMNDRPMTLEEVIDVFHKSWLSEGFLSAEHEQQRRKAGEEALHNFFDKQEKSPYQPEMIEKEFNFVIDYDRVTGRWDRVDKRDGEIHIVDFKSSNVRRQKDADNRAKNSLQLAIYALAYEMIYEQRPKSVELHFLDTGIIGRSSVSDKALQKARDCIKEASRGIRKRDYTAKPGYNNCKYCAYSDVCPATLKD